MGVSKNNGTPKSSILIAFSIISHPFWGPTSIFGSIYIYHESIIKGQKALKRGTKMRWLSGGYVRLNQEPWQTPHSRKFEFPRLTPTWNSKQPCLMDVWWNNHFSCKAWNHPIETTILKWMAIRFQVDVWLGWVPSPPKNQSGLKFWNVH